MGDHACDTRDCGLEPATLKKHPSVSFRALRSRYRECRNKKRTFLHPPESCICLGWTIPAPFRCASSPSFRTCRRTSRAQPSWSASAAAPGRAAVLGAGDPPRFHATLVPLAPLVPPGELHGSSGPNFGAVLVRAGRGLSSAQSPAIALCISRKASVGPPKLWAQSSSARSATGSPRHGPQRGRVSTAARAIAVA